MNIRNQIVVLPSEQNNRIFGSLKIDVLYNRNIPWDFHSKSDKIGYLIIDMFKYAE